MISPEGGRQATGNIHLDPSLLAIHSRCKRLGSIQVIAMHMIFRGDTNACNARFTKIRISDGLNKTSCRYKSIQKAGISLILGNISVWLKVTRGSHFAYKPYYVCMTIWLRGVTADALVWANTNWSAWILYQKIPIAAYFWELNFTSRI